SISVGRTYDSLERSRVQDFGNGWSLALMGPRLEVNPLQNVSLTLFGRRFTFFFTPVSQAFPFVYLKAPVYTPEPGTFGTLTGDGCSLLYISDQAVNCFPDFSAYKPTIYTYTDPSGRVYKIGADGSLKSIKDPNGNTLTVTANGITSSVG